MKKIVSLTGVLLLAACASIPKGVVPGEHGTYVLQKDAAGAGPGQLEPLKQAAYAEATAYCARSELKMEVVQYQEVDGKFGRVSSLMVVFECVPRP